MKKDKIKMILFIGIIFIFTYIFFTRIHKLVIFDADDWTYVSEPRSFIPLWGVWNPAKLFPESLMPLCGSIASYLVNPFINDYVRSITIVSAFVVSTFISIYIYMFSSFIKKKFKHSTNGTIVIGLLFFLFHFLLFAVKDMNNQYLFWSHNVNCYYNYLIPNLVNFSLIFYLLSNDIDYSTKFPKNFKYGIILLLIYISIFSNMFCNIIIGVFAGVEILVNFIKERKKINIKEFFKKYFLLFVILVLWLVALIFELNGGRAESPYNVNFITAFIESAKNLGYMLKDNINFNVLLVSLITLIGFIISIFKNKKEDKSIYIKLLLCVFITGLYYTLICAKVGPNYIFRAEDIFGFYAFGLILIFICLGYLLKKYPSISMIIPIVLCFFIVELNMKLRTFTESNTSNIDPSICEKLDNDFINQIKEADEKGVDHIELHVPDFNSNDNWPIATYFGKRIAKTAYIHGITKKQLTIDIVIDKEKNKEYQIYN